VKCNYTSILNIYFKVQSIKLLEADSFKLLRQKYIVLASKLFYTLINQTIGVVSETSTKKKEKQK